MGSLPNPPRWCRLSTLVLVWASTVALATQLHRVDLAIGDGICGPWGCAAAPEALLGVHLLWMTLLVPTATLVCFATRESTSRWISGSLLASGVLGALAIFAFGSVDWLLSGEPARYALQRGGFELATATDLPVLQLAVSGGIARIAKRREIRTSVDPEPHPIERSLAGRENHAEP